MVFEGLPAQRRDFFSKEQIKHFKLNALNFSEYEEVGSSFVSGDDSGEYTLYSTVSGEQTEPDCSSAVSV